MKNVAYKTIQNNPNLPNGFIIDHFETDDDTVPGYTVVDKNVFSQILANNVTIMRMHETSKGIKAADPNQPTNPPRPNNEAQPVDQALMAEKKKEIAQKAAAVAENAALFKQFLAWKASQGSDS
jgi:hypothetical protein